MPDKIQNQLVQDRANPRVVIIGAGMTGIQLVIKLREVGITNITVIEKADTVGGTWRENTYPGVACDVPSHAYTYSFETNPDWSNHFPAGHEIHGYFKRVFSKYGIDAITRFNETVTSCIYDETIWTVTTNKGNTFEADLLFSATGILHHPNYPDIKGRETFANPNFHTSRWDHTIELAGKRIGVIGTGSTAAQCIPELISKVGIEVSVFQRTPQWILETKDTFFTNEQKQKFRTQPWRISIIRAITMFIYAKATSALTSDRPWDRFMHKLMSYNVQRNLNKSIKDPALRKKLTPDYKFGCKRLVMNSTFYEAIQQPNATLVTEGIDQIEPNGVVTKDGKLHELDVLVYATGFDPRAYMGPMEFVGRNGISIQEAWSEKIHAYRSVNIPNFPNFFLMLGPNSPIGNNSVIEMSERQTDYAIQIIKRWQSGELDTIEPKTEATQNWMAMLKERMGHTVWTSGCNSWYLDKDGDALAWPDKWNNWIKAMSQPNFNDFIATTPEANVTQENLSLDKHSQYKKSTATQKTGT